MAEAKDIKALVKQKTEEAKKKETAIAPATEKLAEKKEHVKELKQEAAATKEAKTVETKAAKPADAKAEAKKEEKEKPKEERIITVPLRDAWKSPRTKRVRAAVKVLKRELRKHLKTELKIDESVNLLLWARGMKHPPRRIKVKAQIMKDHAKILPA